MATTAMKIAQRNDPAQGQRNGGHGGAEAVLFLARCGRVKRKFIKDQDAVGFRAQHLPVLGLKCDVDRRCVSSEIVMGWLPDAVGRFG